MIDWNEVEKMTAEEIENLRVETIKTIAEKEESGFVVKQKYDQKAKELINLEGQKKDLAIAYSKARHIIKQLKSDLDILTTKFWQKRR